MDGFVEVAEKMVEYGFISLSDTVDGVFILFSKFIPSWLLLLYGQVKDRRGVWDYVEDKAPCFRRALNLNCTFTVTKFWEEMIQCP